ncbi:MULTISPECIES: LLM class flavin-dependent oxidoreductase [unclassified Nocardiopsis]|uniref:LLM class flavin-dependent oxidoreductase n=1 Tax=unclassified Nocardiopsis TaxID=2649073 RepID=UPI001F1C4939|nr:MULTISPECIES: LLM class flavin-dependent oxidoreductase [unclassified Nocardiopsis]
MGLGLLREHLDALHALLAGEKVTVRGRYVRLDGVALDHPAHHPPTPRASCASPPTGVRAPSWAEQPTTPHGILKT